MKHLNILKSFLLLIAVLICALPISAQMVSNNNEDEVNKVDQYAPHYRPGQVIVKFRENSSVNLNCENGRLKSTGVSDIDKVMTTLGITEAEKLMPLTGDIKNRAPHKAKALSGREIVEPNLSKLYCLKFEENEERNVLMAVEMLKGLKDVEFAEPNYLAFIQATEESTTYQSEPLFSEQWGLNAINMPQLWAMDKAEETRPVIAILDTGVDITHPDLADNIWTNANEADGANYTDDDANGYVDDVHGWDFIAGTAIINNGMDRNGHGTHCAGIAAAVGNNDIGITGANPDALILPIKVMNDDGTGDIATICRGIDYATACGAHVLSMSFGTGMPSAAMYQSLCNALTNYAVLVGAAGNSGTDINVYSPLIPSPSFPGAYDIVVGVMASNSDGQLAGFSNYDLDGPFFSKYNMDKAFSNEITWNDEAMWNYDVMAPGVGIMSTYLNGSYKTLNGTSMATPMVAGAISRILQVKGFDYAMDHGLMGDMAIAKDGGITDLSVFNAYQAASFDETNRQVALALIALEIDDSEGDGDGRIDAGETISIWPTIRSLWGHAENIKIAIEPYDDNVPTDALEILSNNVDFGWSLNSRGSYKSQNPIRFIVNENANDGLHLPYKIIITSDNLLAGVEQEHVFEVENINEISGIISEDMILYPKKYIITNATVFQEGTTLTIMPGATIVLKNRLVINGKLICNGAIDKMIVFENPQASNNNDIEFLGSEQQEISYSIFDNTSIYFPNSNLMYSSPVTNCIIKNFTGYNHTSGNTHYCNIINNFNRIGSGSFYCNYINNSYEDGDYFSNYFYAPQHINAFNIPKYKFGANEGATYHLDMDIYWGSDNVDIIKKNRFYDNTTNPNYLYLLEMDNYLHRPVKEAHGIVWKVVVDGYDAQDEFDQLPPLGVGRHKFEIYFNRDDMDHTAIPRITMGLREPYTQIAIAEDGAWSQDDGVDVYTAYLTITGKTNADGLNRIYVTGAKDYDHFDVPYEKTRFNVLVQAVGSMATGFAAQAGLGKVDLTWNNENNDFEDAMGFNVYRFQLNANNDTINKVRVNETIIDLETEEYTDFNVTAGETYYYYYKVMSTDLKEYDISNVVAATPLTSIKGDANGSMSVNIADVVTIVSYLSQQDPQPFIFDAADVNEDGNINILDIVGVINIIAHPNTTSVATADATVIYTISDGILYVDSPVALGGVQVTVNAAPGVEVETLEALDGMERTWIQLDENTRMLLSYSMSGKSIPAGRVPLLDLGSADMLDIVLSDIHGNEMMVVSNDIPTIIDDVKVEQVTESGIYDIMGRKISSNASDINRLPSGIYIVNGKKVVK